MERTVLVLFTGGTIGMDKDENGVFGRFPGGFASALQKLPMLHDSEYAEVKGLTPDKCALPVSNDGKRVIYKVQDYDPLKDSSNIGMEDWIQMAEDIELNYSDYVGIVILHGTDTMAYTASALSFLMENLSKPVIVTGAQVPLSEMRSDGQDNLLGALYIAGHYRIPEVTLFFSNRLYRGNRSMKVSADHFEAFDSPNLPPLLTMAVNIQVSWESIRRRPSLSEEFKVHKELNRNVGLLRLFPAITPATIHAFLQPPMEGVVLHTYGAGNCPSNREHLEEIETACSRGLIIVNCTQCTKGTVAAYYETGSILVEAGVVSGLDMTPEAALSKLSYVLSLTTLDLEKKKEMMSTNIRGEMSVLTMSEVPGEGDLVQ